MFYTYAHYKPEGGLFYIGKGTLRRVRSMDARNPHWSNIVRKYGKPHVEILASWKTEAEALDHEKLLISCFKDMGFDLANKTDGGEGTSGYKFNDQQKKNLSDAHLGQVSWNKGLKGVQVAWNKGLPINESHKRGLTQKVTCPNCGKTGMIGGMKAWHFDKCKDINPFAARVTVNGKRFQIGRYKTKDEAKMAQINYYKEHSL